MSRHLETFEKVTVTYDHSTGYLYVHDYDTDARLIMFHVNEED